VELTPVSVQAESQEPGLLSMALVGDYFGVQLRHESTRPIAGEAEGDTHRGRTAGATLSAVQSAVLPG
jgi:hypothetical protein